MNKYRFLILLFLLTGSAVFSFIYLTEKEEHSRKIKLSGALSAFDFWGRQRAYPNKDIPQDLYYKAYEQAAARLNKSGMKWNWEEIGPHNIGGRTLSLAINNLNPNTIYAGSASGGLWVSYTGGKGVKAWSYVPTGHPVLGVSSIVINPADTNTIYIGTGEVYNYNNAVGGLSVRVTRGSYGIGILKTTNYGITWTKSLDWSYSQRMGVQVIKIHPNNRNILYAGTTEGVYKTTDAGGTWLQVHSAIMVSDLVINKTNPDIIVSACGNLGSPDKGIYKSTNGGGNWTLVSTGFPSFAGKIQLSDVASNPNIIWASVGMGSSTNAGTRVYKTTDFGTTWTLINSSTDYATYQGWYSHFVVPHTDGNKLLFGGIDIWKSINGGATIITKSFWNSWYFGVVPIGGPEGPPEYSHADHHCFAVHPTNPDIVYFGNDGGVFRTTDFGETFEGLNGSYQTTQFYKRFSVARTDSFRALGGMQDNSTAVWEGTPAWRRVLGGDGCNTQISPTNADSMLGSYQYLSMAVSTDRGLNWDFISGPPSSNEAFNAPFLIAPNNSKLVYAAGSRVHKSTDFGITWNSGALLNGDPCLSLAISYQNPDTVYATTAPGLYRTGVFRSVNGGASFTNVTGSLPNRYPVDISVDPRNSNNVYVILSGFGSSHLYKSTNGGTSWFSIGDGLPDVPTSAIAIDPLIPGYLYVGNDLGVYFSHDDGATWRSLNEGIEGAVLVMDLNINEKTGSVFIATHGRGVYKFSRIVAIVGVQDKNNVPSDYSLLQNYPNPFNGSTLIKYSLPKEESVSLKLYDAAGRLVKELVSGNKAAGNYEYRLDRSTFSSLASGIYFYRISAGKYIQTRKMVLLK